MNFATILEKRYENSRFAHFSTNSFALIRKNFAFVRETYAFLRKSYALIPESFASFRESYALFREGFALIREKKYNFFPYENEPIGLS